MLRNELARAEGELDDRCWTPPHGLQQWLQLTHEIENKAYIKKKISAEKQLQQAREAVILINKNYNSKVIVKCIIQFYNKKKKLLYSVKNYVRKDQV